MTEHELRGPLWTAPYRGVRRWSAQGRTAETVVSDAAALLPGGCALGGWASAYHQGIRFLDGNVGYPSEQPVVLVATKGHQLRHRDGIRPRRILVPPDDIALVDGVPCAVLDLAGLQQMCWSRSLGEAVVVADMLTSVRTGEPTIGLDRLRRRISLTKKSRGIVQARTAADLADDRSASPHESRVRMIWVIEAGLPRPLVNAPVFSTVDGRLLGYADLLDPVAGHVHEIDGSQHQELEQRTSDNTRQEAFENHNLTMSRSTRSDLRDPWSLSRRMLAANRRGLRRNPALDRWTLRPPPGWQEPGRPVPHR